MSILAMDLRILSEEEMMVVDALQADQQREWKSVAPKGYVVEFFGRALTVLPNVFPPKEDTRFLAETITIHSKEAILDVGTGTGALAIYAADHGANSVLGVDINAAAVINAQLNVRKCNLSEVVTVQRADVFDGIRPDSHFHVILANLPGRKKVAPDMVASAQWDGDFRSHRLLFEGAWRHLPPDGRLYMVKANYPDLLEMIALAENHGLGVEVVSSRQLSNSDPRIYYVLSLSKAKVKDV